MNNLLKVVKLIKRCKIELTCEKLEEDYLHFQEDRIQDSEAEMDYVSRKILEKGKGAK